MILKVTNLSVDYGQKNFNYTFEINKSYKILGQNGSGKTTLIKSILGLISNADGQVEIYNNEKIIYPINFYNYVCLVSPYLELDDFFTLKEFLIFHFDINKNQMKLNINDTLIFLDYLKEKDKKLAYFSTGMLQKLKLGISILSNKPFLLMDEPFSNLDPKTIEWFLNVYKKYSENKCIIVASNYDQMEMKLGDEIIEI